MEEEDLFSIPVWKIKDIKQVEVRFHIVKRDGQSFLLLRDDKLVATLPLYSLDDRTISKLTSLAEYKIDSRKL